MAHQPSPQARFNIMPLFERSPTSLWPYSWVPTKTFLFLYKIWHFFIVSLFLLPFWTTKWLFRASNIWNFLFEFLFLTYKTSFFSSRFIPNHCYSARRNRLIFKTSYFVCAVQKLDIVCFYNIWVLLFRLVALMTEES